MNLVSIIIPVYKVEKYLSRCVESILKQTYKNIEIILVDDGSPDESPAICDDFARKYKNINVIHKNNGGLSSARNAGLDICKGKYIAFVDSDDYVDSNFIMRLYNAIEKNDADIAMLQYAEVSEENNLPAIAPAKEILYKKKEVEKAFLELKVDSVCVGLYRKEIIGNHRFIEEKTSEDIPFNFEVFKEAQTFVYIPEKRYYYFYNPDSISNGSLDKNMLNYLYFRKMIVDYYDDKDEELLKLAKALYARAAFGLQCRMALFGIGIELNEKECKQIFTSVYRSNRKEFFKERSIPVSRKIMAIAVFNFYPFIKLLRGIKK